MIKRNTTNIVIYKTLGDDKKIQVRIENENVWLNQRQMAELFNVDLHTINEHLVNIYKETELYEIATIRNFRTVQKEGSREVTREVKYYNLDAILTVGYRVRSIQGTQFRQWATEHLREYLIKGFTIDDERLKQAGGRARYFQELIQRIRDIRSSERMFYQKVTDIYTTSIDYQVNTGTTNTFFATVQNKIHYAVHGHTAAEIILIRADGSKPLMGLTSFKGSYVTTTDVLVAKNYLTEPELNQLNLIVSLYIDFAELQAINGRLMKMQDWIDKLDEFLKVSEKKILHTAGTVSAKEASEKALKEFNTYRQDQDSKYISDFDREVRKLINKIPEKITRAKK